MHTNKKRVLPIIFVALSSFAIIVFSFFDFSLKTNLNEFDQIKSYEKEYAENEVFCINSVINRFTDTLNNIASSVSDIGNLESQETYNLLLDKYDETTMGNLGYATKDGILHSVPDYQEDISGYDFFNDAFNGKSCVSSITALSDNNKTIFRIAVPVLKNNNIVGIIVGSYYVDNLYFFDMSNVNSAGYSHIILSNGSYITPADESNSECHNLFDEIRYADFGNSYSYDKIYNDINEGKSGFISYNDGEAKYAYYTPIGINDWYVFSITSNSIVSTFANASKEDSILFIFRITAAFGVLIIFLLITEWRSSAKLVKINNSILLNEERMKIALTNISCLLFEYNISEDSLEINYKSDDFFDIKKEKQERFIQSFSNHPHLPIENKPKLEALIKRIQDGESTASEIINAQLSKSLEPHWYKISVAGISNPNSPRINTIIGTMQDIHKQVEKEMNLTAKAELDQLTSLYNRVTSENIINTYLCNASTVNSHNALLVIDLDNFKEVNDRYGHVFGDAVLVTFSQHLNKIFRATDVISRVGGDEFAVLMKNIDNINDAVVKANKLCTTFYNRRSSSKIDMKLSCSVGIVSADYSDNFTALYKLADIALYEAKKTGKNRCIVYQKKQK